MELLTIENIITSHPVATIATHQSSYAKYSNKQNIHFVSTLVTNITPSSRWSPRPLYSLPLAIKYKQHRQMYTLQ